MIVIRTLSQLKSFAKRTHYDTVIVYKGSGRNRNRTLVMVFDSYEYDSNGCSCYEPNVIGMKTTRIIYNPKRAGTSYRAFDEARHIVDPRRYPLEELPF
jgi:hypothetical protein